MIRKKTSALEKGDIILLDNNFGVVEEITHAHGSESVSDLRVVLLSPFLTGTQSGSLSIQESDIYIHSNQFYIDDFAMNFSEETVRLISGAHLKREYSVAATIHNLDLMNLIETRADSTAERGSNVYSHKLDERLVASKSVKKAPNDVKAKKEERIRKYRGEDKEPEVDTILLRSAPKLDLLSEEIIEQFDLATTLTLTDAFKAVRDGLVLKGTSDLMTIVKVAINVPDDAEAETLFRDDPLIQLASQYSIQSAREESLISQRAFNLLKKVPADSLKQETNFPLAGNLDLSNLGDLIMLANLYPDLLENIVCAVQPDITNAGMYSAIESIDRTLNSAYAKLGRGNPLENSLSIIQGAQTSFNAMWQEAVENSKTIGKGKSQKTVYRPKDEAVAQAHVQVFAR